MLKLSEKLADLKSLDRIFPMTQGAQSLRTSNIGTCAGKQRCAGMSWSRH